MENTFNFYIKEKKINNKTTKGMRIIAKSDHSNKRILLLIDKKNDYLFCSLSEEESLLILN